MELTYVKPRDLVGSMFTTPKELRHLAEQQFSQLFVPTDVIATGAHRVAIALRLNDFGRVVVHAERARHWYPYRVTRVEAGRAEFSTERLRIAG